MLCGLVSAAVAGTVQPALESPEQRLRWFAEQCALAGVPKALGLNNGMLDPEEVAECLTALRSRLLSSVSVAQELV